MGYSIHGNNKVKILSPLTQTLLLNGLQCIDLFNISTLSMKHDKL